MAKTKKPFLSGNRRRTVGVILIILPFVLIIGSAILWVIATFVTSSLANAQYGFAEIAYAQDVFGESPNSVSPVDQFGPPTLGSTAANLIRVFLGLTSIVGIFGIFIFIPIGLYLLLTKHPSEREKVKPL